MDNKKAALVKKPYMDSSFIFCVIQFFLSADSYLIGVSI